MKKAALMAFALILSSCSTLTSMPVVDIESDQGVAILPLKNLSSTPLAGEQVAVLAESILRSRGLDELETYEPVNATGLSALIATSSGEESGISWARESGYDFALSGTVHEWHYKGGADREPTVALSLQLIDVVTTRVVWQATSAKAGWGFSSLSTVGQNLVKGLLGNVRITHRP